ncbi:MAG: cell division protein ZapA [Defluviitaleaceae bacterium]|nr:cell division protein ZapA [Defluviitaleaceae bacterium]
MSEKKPLNRVEVVIGGEIVTLKSKEKPEYLQKLASYVDQKMRAVKKHSLPASIDDNIKSLLIALNIADDYFKTKLALEAKERELRKTNQELTDLIKSFDSNKDNVLTLALTPPQVMAEPRKGKAANK